MSVASVLSSLESDPNALKTLEFMTQNPFKGKDTAKLIRRISKYKNVKIILHLKQIVMDYEDVKYIADSLTYGSVVDSMHFLKVHLGDKGLIPIAESLKNNSYLIKLSL